GAAYSSLVGVATTSPGVELEAPRHALRPSLRWAVGAGSQTGPDAAACGQACRRHWCRTRGCACMAPAADRSSVLPPRRAERGTSSPVRLLVSAASGDGDVAMNPATIEIVATVLFALAIVHTFSTKFFLRLAHRQPAHAGSWHLLGEVEVVFGFWALVLVLAIALVDGVGDATAYVDSRNYTEPMFVFAIMVIAGTRPILWAATRLV